MRTWLPAVLVRTALAALLAFAIAEMPQASTAADPYEIDAMISLTGGGSFTGHDMSQSLAGLEDYVNHSGGIGGRPLKFVIHDDQTSPQVAVQIFNEIAAKHPAVVIGPAIAATCAAVGPLVTNIVAYCLSPSARPAPGAYVFSTSTASADQLLAIMRYFGARGINRIATLTSTDATGQDAERGIVEAMAKVKGVEIVDREHFGTTDISVAAQIVRVKSSQAQLLIAWTTGTPFGTILRSVSDEGLTLPMLTTAGNMSLVQLKQYGGSSPRSCCFRPFPGSRRNSSATRRRRTRSRSSTANSRNRAPRSRASCTRPSGIRG